MATDENTLLSSIKVNQKFTDSDIQKIIVKDLQRVYNSQVSNNSSVVSRLTLLEDPTGVTAGTYGSETQSAQITIDTNGRITSAANITIASSSGTLSDVLTAGNTTGPNDIVVSSNQGMTQALGTITIDQRFYLTGGSSWYTEVADSSNTTSGGINIGAGGTQQIASDVTSLTQVLLSVNNLLATSTKSTFEGIVYGADYSANYTARSLIDKGYAAATFAPIGSGVTSVNSATGAVTLTHTTAQGVSGVWTGTALALTLGALTGVTSFNGLVVTANTGAITTGTWNGTIISSNYGGTGVNNAGRTLTINTNNGTLDFTSAVTLTIAATASISGTNTGDNSVNSLYSGLVSNATHTGDAIGATTLTVVKIQNTAIPAPVAGDDGKFIKYDHGTTAFIYDTVSGGSGLTQPQVMARISMGF